MRPTPPAPTPWSTFLAWPAGSSLVFLLSAACLLGGAWGVLAPGMDNPEAGTGRLLAAGAVAGYALALLAIGGLLCRWRRGNPDAVGPALLAACFAAGAGAALDAIAYDHPRAALLLAAGGLLAALAGWRWFVRSALGTLEVPLAAAGAALLLWNLAAPVWLAWSFRAAHADPLGEWLTGGWLAALVPLALLPAVRAWRPQADRDEPFLRRAGMRWILLLVLLAAGILHLVLLDYAFTLGLGHGAWLAPVLALLLLAGELRARAWGADTGWDAVVGLAPPLLVLACAVADHGSSAGGFVDAAVLALAAALVQGGMGWFRDRRVQLDHAIATALVALLAWDASGGWTGLRWTAFLWAAPAAIALVGLRRRRAECGPLAVIVAAYAVVTTPEVALWLASARLAPAAVGAVVVGVGILALSAWLRSLPTGVRRSAAWALALGIAHCTGRSASALYGPLAGALGALTLLAAAAVALRDRWLLLPAAVPLAVSLARADKAWLAVQAAFALLPLGAWMSWRRHRRPPTSGDTTVVEAPVPRPPSGRHPTAAERHGADATVRLAVVRR